MGHKAAGCKEEGGVRDHASRLVLTVASGDKVFVSGNNGWLTPRPESWRPEDSALIRVHRCITMGSSVDVRERVEDGENFGVMGRHPGSAGNIGVGLLCLPGNSLPWPKPVRASLPKCAQPGSCT